MRIIQETIVRNLHNAYLISIFQSQSIPVSRNYKYKNSFFFFGSEKMHCAKLSFEIFDNRLAVREIILVFYLQYYLSTVYLHD